MSDPTFIPGRELSRQLYVDGVRPLLEAHDPGLSYAAALIGPGSDVLGFDTARSMDHDWGPRMTLVLSPRDLEDQGADIDALLRASLPPRIAGFPTRFREFPDDPGIMHMADDEDGPLAHRITITTLPDLLDEALGVRSVTGIDVPTWLTVPEQTFLELTGGAVYRDDHGELTAMRDTLAWYPDDLWRYRLAAAWKRIAQVEPFIGRTGEVGDDLGSEVIALSLARDIMRLALLQERRYAPYAKWLGTAFARLDVAPLLLPHLDAARYARTWQAREDGIVGAVSILAERHNRLGLTPWIDPEPRTFHSRPFTVIAAERFADALAGTIADERIRSLPRHLGGIDQFIDSTDALMNHDLRLVLRAVFHPR